jgi:carbamoyl-phosphate synthase large subunit
LKRKIFISAAGTATAFHLADLIRTQFSNDFVLCLGDINPPHLVASAALADSYFQVPLAVDPHFRRTTLNLFETEKIELYFPLIDTDVYTFPSDDDDLRRLRISSAGPPKASVELLRNKRMLSDFLSRHKLPVARTLEIEEALASPPETEFFVKPELGWGSRGARVETLERIRLLAQKDPNLFVQEVCVAPEITVEVFNGDSVFALCRERLETKAGVCTKARAWFDSELSTLATALCGVIAMPVAFCFQVMKNQHGAWVITDVNPRMGAGTALATCCGWSLASAALVEIANLPRDSADFLETWEGNRFALRAFREVRTF